MSLGFGTPPRINGSPQLKATSKANISPQAVKMTPSKTPLTQNGSSLRRMSGDSTSYPEDGTTSPEHFIDPNMSVLSDELPTFDMSVSFAGGNRSVWDDGEMSFDLVTETDGGAVDEEFMIALNNVKEVHARTSTQYRRLLEQAHGASAAQLHALQAELRILRQTVEDERKAAREIELERDRMLTQNAGLRNNAYESIDLATALRGDGRGTFNEIEVRKAVRTLKMEDRQKL